MIKIYRGKEAFAEINKFINKADSAAAETESGVKEIISRVAKEGDSALDFYAAKFGDQQRNSYQLKMAEVEAIAEKTEPEARRVIEEAATSIREFALGMQSNFEPVVQHRKGYSIGLEYKAVEKVACYVPGGRFPLPSTALMTAIPARVAGVEKVIVTSPSLAPEVAYAALVAGADAFYCLGGAQAVAAFALGTESVEKVDMIVGPGNAWVTEAKKQLQGRVGIDMLAGPSEVAIIADSSADPLKVTVDILAQAEHDPDARAWLLTDSQELANSVAEILPGVVADLELPEFISEALSCSGIFVLDSLDECLRGCNLLAPEHLHLNTGIDAELKKKLKHFGSLFMGGNCSVPFGDYMAGPNHTLPTGTSARFSSGLSPLTFMRTQTWTSAEGNISELATGVELFARLEGLKAHAEAARLRK